MVQNRDRPRGILEVAARAGVSPATVSRALRGIPGVSATTRKAVEQAAHELGYVASASASALARGRTSTVGVMSQSISRWFFTAVIEGADDVIRDAGYDVLLCPLDERAGTEAVARDFRGLRSRVDGVLGLNSPLPEHRAVLDEVSLPLVTVGSTIEGVPGVLVDDVEVGKLATRHLIGLGHRRIAFLGLDPRDSFGLAVAEHRYSGYRKALREANIPEDPDLLATTGFDVDGGEAAVDELLAKADGNPAELPTAVVAVSDEVAMGVLYAARKRGIRVPQDLSVVGVDNHDLAHLFDLTTVAQPVREQGRIAAGLLLQIMTGKAPIVPEVVRLVPGLIERNTTAPPRAIEPTRQRADITSFPSAMSTVVVELGAAEPVDPCPRSSLNEASTIANPASANAAATHIGAL